MLQALEGEVKLTDSQKSAIAVMVAGFIGGLASCLYSTLVGTRLPVPWYGAIPGSGLLGAGAGFIGVFVLANSDMRAVERTLGFAFLCGLAWKPVYDGGGALVQQTIKQKVESTAVSEAETTVGLATALPTAPKGELPGRIAQAKGHVLSLIEKSQQVDDPEAKQKINRATEQVLGSLQNVDHGSDANVESVKIDAYRDIGAKAIEYKDYDLLKSTMRSLKATPWSTANQVNAEKALRDFNARVALPGG